jgi:WD40 repeat protein
MKSISYMVPHGKISKRGRILTFITCVFTLSGVTSALIGHASVNEQAPGSIPPIRLRSVLRVGDTSDKPIVTFSADGQLIATGTGHGPVKLWQTSTGQLIAELDGTEGQSPRAFSPTNDRLLASANLRSVSLYNLSTMQLRSQIVLDKLFGSLNLFGSFSPDGREFLIYSEHKVSLWSIENARLIASQPCEGAAFGSQFSRDSQKVLTLCDGEKVVKLLDSKSGKVVLTLSHPSQVATATFSPDNTIVATSTLFGQIALWDTANGQLKKAWQAHGDLISYIDFSPDGKILATLSRDGSAKLWDITAEKLEATLHVGSGASYTAFSPDGGLLTVIGEGNKKEITVWNVATGQARFTITGHQKGIRKTLFSPDGRLLISSSDDTVNVWDVVTGKSFTKLQDAHFPVALSRNGKILATGGSKGTVILWEVVQ